MDQSDDSIAEENTFAFFLTYVVSDSIIKQMNQSNDLIAENVQTHLKKRKK